MAEFSPYDAMNGPSRYRAATATTDTTGGRNIDRLRATTTARPAEPGRIQRNVPTAGCASSSSLALARAPFSSSRWVFPGRFMHVLRFATNNCGDAAFRRPMLGSRFTSNCSAGDGPSRPELPRPWKLMPRWELPAGRVRRRRSMLPEEERDVVGTVMSLDRNINAPRHFGLPSNPIARELLGRLGNGGT